MTNNNTTNNTTDMFPSNWNESRPNCIDNGLTPLSSQNRTKEQPIVGQAIGFNPLTLSASTIAFLQAYNTGAALRSRADRQETTAFGCISIHEIPSQLMTVLTSCSFSNDQAKQTFKISCQRFFRACHQGKALIIKGDSVKVHTLAADETTDHKGKVIKIKTAEQVAADKAAADKAAADKKQQQLDAEQATLRLDAEKSAREQAEATAAAAIKHANEQKKAAAATVAKAETATELLSKQVADLTLQLERAKHETSATIVEYRRLIDGIKTAKTLTDVKRLAGISVVTKQPARLQANA